MSAIIAEVAARGRVTFAEFMALALYHPEAGYYTRPRAGAGPVGPGGDFLTAPTSSPVFARTLERLLRSLAVEVGEPLTFVELGAGEGPLLRRLLDALAPDPRGVLRRTVAVETSAWARGRLRASCPMVETAALIHDLARPHGPVVLFASELYDAFPVHRVTVRRHGGTLALAEFYVAADADGRLRWEHGEPSGPEIERYLAEHGVTLEEGQIAEVRPQVRAVHAEHLAWCGHDAVALVLDYGYPARQLYNARGRRQGSLVGYRAHALVNDVLTDPGEVDLTAHVNFDDLENAAADAGWERGLLRHLAAFMTIHGAVALLPSAAAAGAPLSAEEWAELAAAKRLLAPTGMGSDLKVLAQGRGRLWQVYRSVATPPPLEA
jgi:SAM-dependent MidA family methyltransferase